MKVVNEDKKTNLVSLAEFSKMVGYDMDNNLLQVYRPFIAKSKMTSPLGKTIPALYDYEHLVKLSNQYLDKDLKPVLEERLRKTGVRVTKSVILKKDIVHQLAKCRNKIKIRSVIFIYMPVKRIFEEYGLIGAKALASRIAKTDGLNTAAVYMRIKKLLDKNEIKPVAYGNKLNAVYFEDILVELYYSSMKGKGDD